MTSSEIHIQNRNTVGFLVDKSLKDAFKSLRKMIEALGPVDLINSIDQLETTYKFMLQYTIEGVNDPERQSIYNKLIEDTYALLDKTTELLKEQAGVNWIITQKKNFKQKPKNSSLVRSLSSYKVREELIDLISNPQQNSKEDKDYLERLTDLFDYLWLTDSYKTDDISTVNEIVNSKDLTSFEKCLTTSAITFSLLRVFDTAKFDLLLTIYATADNAVKMRALTGLILSLIKYADRLEVYTAINNRFLLLSDDKEFIRLSEIVILQLLSSRETEKITKKFQEDILPEIARISPNLRDKLDLENLLSKNLYDEDKNPDWQEMLGEVPGLTKKLEELSELQMEGADVFMGTFAMLKHFPFFNRLINWFIPFSTKHPEIAESIEGPFNATFIESIGGSTFLCNSDKYSFCLSMQQIPQAYKEMLGNSVNSDLGELEKIGKEDAILDQSKHMAQLSNQYIQDLYRFFKLHPQNSYFDDVLGWELKFHKSPQLSSIFDNSEIFNKVASFYFTKDYFEEALELFTFLNRENSNDSQLYQKMGYCYQKLNNFEMALEQYLKADLLNSGNHWTAKKIAFCYRQLKVPQKALEYYRQAEKLKPDNLSTQISIGHCYLELENYAEALKCYFQVEYLAPNNNKIWRPIAWCSFLEGKLQQSEKYYSKLLNDSPTYLDVMNAGHVQWALQKPKRALELYKESILKDNKNFKRFFSNFELDKEFLIGQGVNSSDIPFLIDRLKYDLFS